jgi:DNA-binding XRE family transcriptional regulator
MNLETVEKNGQKFVLVPIEQYNQVLEELEMLEDIRDFEEAEAADEESFPSEVVNRLILDEENPIKVFREYRGLTQEQLADKAGIQRADLAAMEIGQESGSAKTLMAIAEALELDDDDLIS